MEMTLFDRTLSIVGLAAVAILAMGSAGNGVFAAPEAVRNVSVSVEAGGSRSVALYSVPTGMTLLVTQACQEHPAMYVEVGNRGDRISYSGQGCTRFEPGFAVSGGQTLNCVNKSGESRTCVLIGQLERSAHRSPGAKFYDVGASK
jgi:hypothetical protein